MTNLWMGFVALFIFGFVLSAIVLGQHGLATTQLAATLTTDSSGPLTVTSTDGFPNSGLVIIDEEHIRYTGRTATTFTGLTRGFNDTNIKEHTGNIRVYNEATGFVNRLVGYRILESIGNDNFFVGLFTTITTLPGVLKQIVVTMIAMDFAFLENPVGVYIKYIMGLVIGAGIVMALIRLFASRGG